MVKCVPTEAEDRMVRWSDRMVRWSNRLVRSEGLMVGWTDHSDGMVLRPADKPLPNA